MADTIRGVVGLFHDELAIRDAVDGLLLAGFDRSDVSVLADHRTIQRRLGHDYAKVTELEDVPMVAAQPYVGPDSRVEANGVMIGALFYVGATVAGAAMVASGSSLLSTVLVSVAAGAAAGLIGAVLVRLIRRRHEAYVRDHLAHGGLLLWVHADDAAKERKADEILRRHSAEQAHVFELPRIDYPAAGGVSYNLSFMNRIGL